MNEQEPTFEELPDAVVQARKRFSIVWVVPVVAVLIGGWLAYKALSEKGPTITITFESAEGLEAGKTKIKYKDVEIGQVESISLSEDLSHIMVTSELVKEAEEWLSENTRFWVVRARVAAGEVSGLGTIFSGAYIAIDPGKGDKPTRVFKGLEIPPIVTTDLPGRHFLLRAERLGSLDIGSPVYFRQIKVGQVVAHKLEKDGKAVHIKIFIQAPHHELVCKNTKFWNASGFDVSVDASGIKVNTESFVTIMIGGIAFDTPGDLEPEVPAKEGETFVLYKSREASLEKVYVEKNKWLLRFDGSVRGLNIGAPVEFKGIKMGKVTNINLEFDWEKLAFQIPVVIETEPERLKMVGEQTVERSKAMGILVDKGLRGQLKQGSLLTGQLYIDLDIHPDAPPGKIVYEGRYPELPTLPTPVEEITRDVTRIVKKLGKLPLEQIGNDLLDATQHLSKTIAHLEKLVARFDKEVAPAATATLQQAQTTLTKVDRLLNADSPMGHEMKRALGELADAARNISILADYLERHPEALIKGKGTSQ
ncbi:MAG TPA: MCE family protein [Desulfobacterales bacterium]|nr:MCE family protein [Desulfobacterales bacterium]